MQICTSPAASRHVLGATISLPRMRCGDRLECSAALRQQGSASRMAPALPMPRRGGVSAQAAMGAPEVCAFMGGVSASTLGTLAGLLVGSMIADKDLKKGPTIAPDNLRHMFHAPLFGAVASPLLFVSAAFWAQGALPEHDSLGWIALFGALCSGLPIA